jgi:hypothetical protein
MTEFTMRRLTLLLLLASAAAPALAAPGDDTDNGRHHRDSNSTEQSESRPQRVRETQQSTGDEQRNFRARHLERTQVTNVDPNSAQQVQNDDASRQGFAQMRERARLQHEQNQAEQATTQTDHSARGEWRQNHDGAQTNWQARERRVRTIPDTNVATAPSRAEREAYQNRHRTDYRNGNYTRWTNNWRHDNRYNWSNYRNHHRSIFHLGYYYDPFGWNYRPWSVGSYLYPSYYGSNFWLDDPWQYRLPPAYGPYRWVRYWDDALMVNIYTGQVVDVIHNFFW